MSWISKRLGWYLGGATFLTFVTGFDKVIYRTLMNYASDLFSYLFVKAMQFGIWFMGYLPGVPTDSNHRIAAENVVSILGKANTFFPVLEFVAMIVVVLAIFFFLIAFRLLLRFVALVRAAIPI